MATASTVLVLGVLATLILTSKGWPSVRETFFSWSSLKESFPAVLRGFGALSVRSREARAGRNPRTGEPVDVRAKHVPFFKSGKELRERLNLTDE